jgi:hypothetical protein
MIFVVTSGKYDDFRIVYVTLSYEDAKRVFGNTTDPDAEIQHWENGECVRFESVVVERSPNFCTMILERLECDVIPFATACSEESLDGH